MSGLDPPPGSPTPEQLAHYGDVSGILRSGPVEEPSNYPEEPSSYIVQEQRATSEGVSRWFTLAVYASREAAEEAAERWEAQRRTFGAYDLEMGEHTPAEEQPLTAHRVVTLLDLFAEGREALGSMLYDLATSDHEWLLSTETGTPGKQALLAAAMRPPEASE